MQKAKGGKHIESGGWPVRAAKVLGMAASINFFCGDVQVMTSYCRKYQRRNRLWWHLS